MNIDQTKCDYCGKVHETPNRSLSPLSETELVSVPLKVDGKARKQYLDFCDEDCLREMLIKRRGANAKLTDGGPSLTPELPDCVAGPPLDVMLG